MSAWEIRSRIVGPATIRTEDVGDGVTRIAVATRVTRLNGMVACLYRLGGLLVDTGFSHARRPIVEHLEGREIEAIACTHHHEDHTGNADVLARRHGCPVYLRNAGCSREEGVVDLLPYRRWFWGPLDGFEYEEMPVRVEVAGRSMVPVPIPGHSVTHTAFHEPSTGVVLVGDLFVSPGVTAVMTHENPFASIDSLRRVAALSPSRMLTGHGLIVEDPAAALGEKADRIEEAARGVLEMHGRGLSEGAIVRRTFRGGWSKDLNLRIATQGEFHRRNFVRACIRHAPGEVS